MVQLATALRRIFSCTSLTLVFCILVTHKHTTKCQTHFRPIKPLVQPRGLLAPTARIASFVQQPQIRHHSNSQKPVMSRPMQMQQLKPSPWPQLHAGVNVGLPAAAQMRTPFQAQQQQQSLFNTFKSANQMMGAALMSDRRASTNQPTATSELNQMDVNYRPAQINGEQQVPIGSPSTVSTSVNDNSLQNKQHHWHEHNGKLLICYYATKQTAPYWPKDSREFIVPANRLDQAATEFLKMNSAPELANKSGQSQRFQSTVSHQPHRQQQNGQFVNNINDNSLSNGLNQIDQSSQFVSHKQQQQPSSIFTNAGGRIVVIAPKFVPFNRSIHTNSKANNLMNHNEIGIDRPDSLAQMFFLANNRRKTIAERQDNGATITSQSTATTSLANNQFNAKQSTPQLAEFIVPNNDRASDKDTNGDGVVVFNQNRSKHDLTNNNNHNAGGQVSNFDKSRIASLKQVLGSTTMSTISSPTLRLPVGNGQGSMAAPVPLSPTFQFDNERSFTVNNRDNSDRTVQARQQLVPAPSTSRAFVVGTTLATSSTPVPPSSIGSHNSDKSENGPLFVQTGPPAINSDPDNFYYYYNLPNSNNNNNQLPQTTSSVVAASSGSIAPTTIGLAASSSSPSSYRPTSVDQQQHHELSGTTLAGFNNNGNPHRGKSLQIVGSDRSDLLQPVATGSVSSLPSSTISQTSYLINNPSQSQPVDRLIVSNGPSSSAASLPVNTIDRQQYLIQSVSSPDSTDDPLKSSTSTNDGRSQIGSKTTPIVHSHLGPSQTSSLTTRRPHHSQQVSSSSFASTGLMSKVDETSSAAINRNPHLHQHLSKQTVGLGGSSLSAALVSSPLSTMFDVFGAASQYLMRFKPSSLISPASFAAFNSIGSDQNSHNKLKSNASSPLSSVASLVSLPFTSHGHHSSSKTSLSNTNDRGSSPNNSSGHGQGAAGSFLTRLSLQSNQRREDICGRTIQMPERRIIGGEGAKYGEFPYQVHIKIAKHQCGGALIDKQSIVTAAHCVYHFITRAPVNKLQIVIGAYDIEDEQYQELPPQYFKVNKVKLHPNFRFSASHPDRYDIAILKLDKPVEYTDNVLPVCLPGKDLKYENMVGTVTGFGKTDPSLSNRYGTRLLQKVDVPIIENGECERWHRTRGIDLKIFPEMMCAGYEDGLKDACVGDSGGPLVVKTPVGSHGAFRWTLAGITSAGFGCAQSRQPGIYHRVSHTVDWILENLD